MINDEIKAEPKPIEWLSVRAAAERAGVTETCIVQWVEKGRRGIGELEVRIDETSKRKPRRSKYLIDAEKLMAFQAKILNPGPLPKVVEGDIEEMKELKAGGMTQADIGRQWGIHESYVSILVRGVRKPPGVKTDVKI